jgi:membrane-bound lytic murein transglycosylase D
MPMSAGATKISKENDEYMVASFPRFIVCAVVSVTLLGVATAARAQVIPAGSSARSIPNEVDKANAQVAQLIARAEDHFRKGKLNLEDNKRDAARDEFDRAVDSILESGLDVRANQRLQTFYLELVERIYREEVPIGHGLEHVSPTALVAQGQSPVATDGQTPAPKPPQAPAQVGFREQKFEPSPLDDLSKLVLTAEEQNVSEADVQALEAAKNNVNFPITINPLIQQYINYYQGRGRSTMESGLRKSGRYMALARRIFKEEGVPADMVWLGQVESAWRPNAYSSAAASGLWQFVSGTGRQYGLRQSAWIDERNSFEQATRASARYLKDLAKRYNGDWELAMAGYNTGAGNIDRGIARAGNSSFWTIYPYLYQETRNYVPNILATILIAKNPEKYGFGGIRPEAPLSYDVVQVPTATSLQLIADATDSNVDFLRSINPELRRDVTPRDGAYNVRVPAGRSKQLVALLKRIPGDKRDLARVISVVPGEDIQSVASRTGIAVGQLQAYNNGVDLKTTTKLVVPTGSVKLASWRRAAPAEVSTTTPSLTKIKARKGDTIAKIAGAHHLDGAEVARLNGLPVNGELQAGQEIVLPAGGATPTAAPRSRRRR